MIVDGVDVTEPFTNPGTVQIIVNGVDRTAEYTTDESNSGPRIILDGTPREDPSNARIFIDGVDVTDRFYNRPNGNDLNRTYVDPITEARIPFSIEEK